MISTRARASGYPTVSLKSRERRRWAYVHRLVLEAFCGPCPAGCSASHLNGNREDSRLVNLAWEPVSNNNLRKRDHGTMHGRLSAALVASWVADRRGGMTIYGIAQKYNWNRGTVSRVIRREVA